MNIEIANRLVSLRKANHLSQEELAAKIGISRQAVSKWERAEASPDTDNLILLAKLYKISLDELLKTDEPINMEAGEENEQRRENDGEENSVVRSLRKSFPYSIFITIVYLILGFGFRLWTPGWLLYLTIPVYYWAIGVIKRK